MLFWPLACHIYKEGTLRRRIEIPLPQAVEKLGPATADGGGIVSITTPIGSLWVGPLEWVLPQEYNGTVTWSGAT